MDYNDYKRPTRAAGMVIRYRWTWGFPGRTRDILTCGTHPMVRYMQRVLGIDVPDDYKIPACQIASIFWMIRRELACSHSLSEEQVTLFDSKLRRVRDQGYFMSPSGVVLIFRRAEISTIYQLTPEKQRAICKLRFSGPSQFSLNPEPHYHDPFPIELLLVPETIDKEWWNGIQAWIRDYGQKKSLLCESGIRFRDQKVLAEDDPVDLIELPSSGLLVPDREIMQAWIDRLMNPVHKKPIYAILRSRVLLGKLLYELVSPRAHVAPWKEHFVPGLVYGIDTRLHARDQVPFFPLCI